MPTYSYRAVDEHGVRVRGQSVATTERALQEELRARGALLLEARQYESGQRGRTLLRSDGVVRFTRSLASLLAAGLPISRALRTAAAIESGDVRSAALELCSRIERGEAVAEAVAARADLFSPVYIGHVRAGEAVGDVAGAFSRIASQLEAEASFRKRLVSASVYPAVLLVMSISATAVLLVFILPRFAALLAGTGAALPVTTRALLAIGPVAGTAAPWVLLLGLLVGITIHRQAGTPAGRERLSYLGFRLPLVGSIRRDVAAARFARVLSGLLHSKLPLTAALAATEAALSDPVGKRDVVGIREEVSAGSELHAAISRVESYPAVIAELVQVGEEAGEVAGFLGKAADLLEQQVQARLERFVTLLEPTIVILFGGIIGFVAVALLQAVYSVNAGSFR